MTRKFITPVNMVIPDYLKWCELANDMIQLGYHADDDIKDKGFPWIMYTEQHDDRAVFAIISAHIKEWIDPDMISIHDYNPELFIALAAMSEGSEFWPGEWLANKTIKSLVKVLKTGRNDSVEIESRGETFWLQRDDFRKATKEEILDHFAKEREFNEVANKILEQVKGDGVVGKSDFTNEKSFFDQVSPEVPYKVESDLTEFHKKVDQIKQPPIGIMPRKLWEEKRIKRLMLAILRYLDQDKLLQDEWVEELNYLLKKRSEDFPF